MSASSHDEFHTDTKPVAFTVPFILALVAIIVMGLFLSLCDPSHDARSGAAQDGYRHGLEKNKSSHGEADGPPAHAESPAEGQPHR